MIVIKNTTRWPRQTPHSPFRMVRDHVCFKYKQSVATVKTRREFHCTAQSEAMPSTFQEHESSVTREFIKVNGIATSVLKLGHPKDGSPDTSLKVMMLIIPGNPGIPHFYEDFMQELHQQSGNQVPVWTVGHACHLKPPGESLRITDVCCTQTDVCGLDAQIAHKVTFINDNIPADVSLILIGHSIGSYMILNMLNDLKNHSVLRCFMLFPTMERMAVSPNGNKYTPILCHLRWLLVFIALLFSLLPRNFRQYLIYWWYKDADYPKCVKDAIVEMLTPWTTNFFTFLAKIEMKNVTELQRDLILKHQNKLSLYYGSSDDWVPKEYYHELVKEFPQLDARLCDSNLIHAFVVETQAVQIMAKTVWLWAQLRCLDQLSSLLQNRLRLDG